MIIYNVTVNIEDAQHEQWFEWMNTIHLPQVMATGMFLSYKMLKLISRQPDETGTTYAIQYTCQSIELYDKYQSEFAPSLQAETKKLFGDKIYAFRTVLEEV